MTGDTSASQTLDRLQQQVLSGQSRIAAVCSRIESLVRALCKDELTRPFITELPKLLAIVLGDERQAGWIEMVADEESATALWNLLRPSGTLFAAASSYSNADLVTPFELSRTQLPVR